VGFSNLNVQCQHYSAFSMSAVVVTVLLWFRTISPVGNVPYGSVPHVFRNAPSLKDQSKRTSEFVVQVV
jgi:hypothetical protein